MKSKKTSIIIMAAVLALLLLTFFLINGRWNNEAPADTGEEEKIYTVSAIDPASITGISYTNGEREYSFTLEGDAWKYDADDKFPLDTDMAAELAEALSEISADKMIEGKPTDSAEYGLDTPAHTVRVTCSDGSIHTYKIGDYNRHSGLYYLTYDKSDKVYMVSSSFASIFTLEEEDYLVLEKMDTVTVDSVTGILADTPTGKITLTVTEDEATGEKTYTHTNAEGGEGTLDAEGAKKIIRALCAPSLTKCADYYAEADELDSYGLGEGERVRVTVSYTSKITTTTVSGGESVSTVEKTCVYYMGKALSESDAQSGDTVPDTATEAEKNEDVAQKVTKTYLVLENSNMIFEVDLSGADAFFDSEAD